MGGQIDLEEITGSTACSLIERFFCYSDAPPRRKHRMANSPWRPSSSCFSGPLRSEHDPPSSPARMSDCSSALVGAIFPPNVWGNEDAIAFRDLSPVAPEHGLVIPREPIESLAELDFTRAEHSGSGRLGANGWRVRRKPERGGDGLQFGDEAAKPSSPPPSREEAAALRGRRIAAFRS